MSKNDTVQLLTTLAVTTGLGWWTEHEVRVQIEEVLAQECRRAQTNAAAAKKWKRAYTRAENRRVSALRETEAATRSRERLERMLEELTRARKRDQEVFLREATTAICIVLLFDSLARFYRARTQSPPTSA